jgi:hypothetical protein
MTAECRPWSPPSIGVRRKYAGQRIVLYTHTHSVAVWLMECRMGGLAAHLHFLKDLTLLCSTSFILLQIRNNADQVAVG